LATPRDSTKLLLHLQELGRSLPTPSLLEAAVCTNEGGTGAHRGMLTHGVARLSNDGHAECSELPCKLCGIMGATRPPLPPAGGAGGGRHGFSLEMSFHAAPQLNVHSTFSTWLEGLRRATTKKRQDLNWGCGDRLRHALAPFAHNFGAEATMGACCDKTRSKSRPLSRTAQHCHDTRAHPLGCIARLPTRLRRQHPIGPYIADFCCIEHHLVVEIDGVTHQSKEAQSYDTHRTAFIMRLGFNVLRCTAADVSFQLEAVVALIRCALPQPLPLAGGVAKDPKVLHIRDTR
jgi:very-short-patch-repair endonuclease